MNVSMSTFRIAMIVIIIVAVLIIVNVIWTTNILNSAEGDTCACSGITDNHINNLNTWQLILLLVAIALLVYAIVMLFRTSNCFVSHNNGNGEVIYVKKETPKVDTGYQVNSTFQRERFNRIEV